MNAPASPDSAFDTLTAVDENLEPPYAHVPGHVSGFGGASGGYVAAVALRAMGKLVGDRTRAARSLTVHLVAAARPGRLDIERQLVRSGKSLSGVFARLVQEDEPVATAMALFGRPSRGLDRRDVSMPDVAPPERCQPLIDKPVPSATAGLLVEHRPASDSLPLAGGASAELLVWMRLVEGRALDALSLTFLADAAPPAIYAAMTEAVSMPSLDIALHYEPDAMSQPEEWVLGAVRSRSAADGYVSEDGELWAPDGGLLVHSRQLRRVLMPPVH